MLPPAQKLIATLEDSFGVSLDVEGLADVDCAAELIDIVVASTPKPEEELQVAAFLQLRRAFVDAGLGEASNCLKNSLVADLLPLGARKMNWTAWGEATGLVRWQPLGRSFTLLAGMAAGGLFVGLVCWHLANDHLLPLLPEGMDLNNLAAFLGALMAWWVFGLVTCPLRLGFPLGVHTVRDLARFAARLEPEAFRREDVEPLTREDVGQAIRAAVVPYLENSDNYHEGAPFPAGLGWGNDRDD